MSCSGSISYMKSTFKMACLAYQPSRVSFGNETFNRMDLIEQRNRLLENQKSLFYQDDEQLQKVVPPCENKTQIQILKDKIIQNPAEVTMMSKGNMIRHFTKSLAAFGPEPQAQNHLPREHSAFTDYKQSQKTFGAGLDVEDYLARMGPTSSTLATTLRHKTPSSRTSRFRAQTGIDKSTPQRAQPF